MSKPEKKGLVPVLRFPEFRDKDEWVEWNFYDLLVEVLDFRGRTPKKLGMDWGGGNIVSLSANNVKNGYIDFSAECNLGSEALYEKWMGKVNLEQGDIVFTMEAPLGNALLVSDSNKYILSQRVVAFKTKPNVNNSFLIQLIWSSKFQSELTKLSTGSTAKGINQKTLQKIDVRIPKDEIEQKKVADCLTSVDELIIAQTQKLDALKAHKKGLMQQLFPAEGETVPRLRFPEFRDKGEWVEIELGQLGELVSGLTYSPDDIRDEGLLVLRSSNVQNGMVALEDNVFVRPDIKGANPTKPNDILICVRNGSKSLIGKNALIPEGVPPCTHGAFMTVFRTKSAKFIFQLFQTDAYERQVSADLGATINSINGNQLRKYKFNVPDPDEQQKIADCLTAIDELITTQAQKVEALKTHKKGLMQQLFPVMDKVSA